MTAKFKTLLANCPLTPKSRVAILALLLGYHAVSYAVDWVYYHQGLTMGMFPTNADSIGIPLNYAWTGWLTLWPFVIVVAAILAFSYRGGLSFFLFDKKRLAWSLIWTIPIALLCAWRLLGAIYGMRWLHVVDFLDALLFCYLVLAIRSSLVAYRSTLAHTPDLR